MSKRIRDRLVRPGWRFLVQHPAHFVAMGFGSGLVPWAPGTFGTIAGVLLYLGFIQLLLPLDVMILCAPVFLLGIWASEVTSEHLGVRDYGGIVIDEIVAVWIVLASVPQDWLGFSLAFVLFRVFDIFKPWPIHWCDRHIKGGLGVMADDILAAVFAIACIGLVYWALPLDWRP